MPAAENKPSAPFLFNWAPPFELDDPDRPRARAPILHASYTNARGECAASASSPADGIHSNCASRTARALESSEPNDAACVPVTQNTRDVSL